MLRLEAPGALLPIIDVNRPPAMDDPGLAIHPATAREPGTALPRTGVASSTEGSHAASVLSQTYDSHTAPFPPFPADAAPAGRPGVDALESLRTAALAALERGEADLARAHLAEAARRTHPTPLGGEWARLQNIEAWPDDWLVASIRRDPPDRAALDALAARHWKTLFGRCQLLTLDRQKASDLAQDAWCRVLRARHSLKVGRSFPAYLTTIATNLWRDWHRAARRAGAMAEHRLASLDATPSTEGDDSLTLADVVPDLRALHAERQRLLLLDVDQALGRLTPPLRDVLIARLLDGESCAAIGRRHARTEQTISAWVREAIRQVKLHLEESTRGASPPKPQ